MKLVEGNAAGGESTSLSAPSMGDILAPPPSGPKLREPGGLLPCTLSSPGGGDCWLRCIGGGARTARDADTRRGETLLWRALRAKHSHTDCVLARSREAHGERVHAHAKRHWRGGISDMHQRREGPGGAGRHVRAHDFKGKRDSTTLGEVCVVPGTEEHHICRFWLQLGRQRKRRPSRRRACLVECRPAASQHQHQH